MSINLAWCDIRNGPQRFLLNDGMNSADFIDRWSNSLANDLETKYWQ